MKYLLLLTLLIPGVAKAANGSGNVSAVVTLGGVNANSGSLNVPEAALGGTAGSTYFELIFSFLANTVNSGSAYAFVKNGTTYQVPSGKTAVCTAMISQAGTNTNAPFQLFSNSVSFANNTATGSLTGSQVYEAGPGNSTQCGHYTSPTANVPVNESLIYSFSATTFPGIISCSTGTAMAIKLFCKEI